MPNLTKRVVTFVLVFALLLSVQSVTAEPPVNIGVLAKRGAEKAYEQWGPTAEYLSKRLKRQFTVVPLKFTEIESALQNRKIDFLLANSAFYARFEKKYNLQAIVTMNNRRNIAALDRFGGVIFTRRNSRIDALRDIRGKRFMCVKFSSFGGAHMAWRLLLESGIDPKKDCASFIEGGTHDNVVFAVQKGVVDVGTVRSDTLERMEAEGKIRISDFKVINAIEDGFPFKHSTRLYPEWPFAACSNVDADTKKNVAKALYLLDSTNPAMQAAKVYSWVRPANYGDVVQCLRMIGLL